MSEPTGRHRDRAPDEFDRLLPLFGELARRDEGDPERGRCRERLITGHLPIVERAVHRYAEGGAHRGDLLQVGVATLIHEIDRFDPDSGGDFLVFAIPAIMGEVRRYFRDSTWPRRASSRPRERHSADAGVDRAAPRPPIAADVASRLGVNEAHVAEVLAAWEAARHRLPGPESEPNE
jgi:DNA-directed RNA polymerase specialized sigma subunit